MTAVFHAQLLTELKDSFRKKVHSTTSNMAKWSKICKVEYKKVDGMHVLPTYYAVKYNICMTNLLRRGRLCTNFFL